MLLNDMNETRHIVDVGNTFTFTELSGEGIEFFIDNRRDNDRMILFSEIEDVDEAFFIMDKENFLISIVSIVGNCVSVA